MSLGVRNQPKSVTNDLNGSKLQSQMLLIALPGFWHQINFAVKFSFNHERKVPKTRVNKDRRDQKTAGLNFINILRTAFTPADPKSVKRIDDLTVFFLRFQDLRV